VSHETFNIFGILLVGYAMGVATCVLFATARLRIRQERQYRWQREQLAAGVPLWEIIKDKRYKA
jgi:hypothetical protein